MKSNSFKVVSCFCLLVFGIATFNGCSVQSYDMPTDQSESSGYSIDEEKFPVQGITCMYPVSERLSPDIDLVEAEINQIILPKIDAYISLQPVVRSNYYKQLQLSLLAGVNVDLAMGNSSNLNETQAYNLSDFLAGDGIDIRELISDQHLKSVTKDGKIFGLPNLDGKAISTQIAMRTDILEKHNIHTDFLHMEENFNDMSEMFEQVETILSTVKESEPDMYPLVLSDVGALLGLIQYDDLGGGAGAIVGKDKACVVNLYESEEFKNLVCLIRSWYIKGYIMPDTSLASESTITYIREDLAFASFFRSEIGLNTQIKAASNYDMTCVKLKKPLLLSNDFRRNVWYIPTTAANPKSAMDFLSLLYTDSDVVNLLAYGVEGKHYEITADGTICYPQGVTAVNSGYSNAQYWQFGNSLLGHVWSGNPPDYNEHLLRNNESAAISPAFGFVFDGSSVQEECALVSSITYRYCRGLLTGYLDCDIVLPIFLDELEQAGVDRVIAEKQRQYDRWLAEE